MRYGDAIEGSACIPGQPREQTVQADADEESGRNSGKHLLPEPGQPEQAPRGFLLPARETGLFRPLEGRPANPAILLPF